MSDRNIHIFVILLQATIRAVGVTTTLGTTEVTPAAVGATIRVVMEDPKVVAAAGVETIGATKITLEVDTNKVMGVDQSAANTTTATARTLTGVAAVATAVVTWVIIWVVGTEVAAAEATTTWEEAAVTWVAEEDIKHLVSINTQSCTGLQ